MLGFGKRIKCKLCPKKVKPGKLYTLNIETAEGPHSIRICPDCMKTLTDMKRSLADAQ